MINVSQSDLGNLEAQLLNNPGNVPLHNRFRALFTLKALKSDEAVRVISKGSACSQRWPVIDRHAGFQDPSALLKHELAYCLGQTKNVTALPILESVLADEREDPMVRHEVSHSFVYRRIHVASCFSYCAGRRGDGCYFLGLIFART